MTRITTRPTAFVALGTLLLFGAACGTAGITDPSHPNTDPNYIYGGSTAGGSSTGTVDPTLTANNQNVAIGFELSNTSAAATAHPPSDTNFWLASARALAAKVQSSTVAARLVVGTYSTTRGAVDFAFPRPPSTTTRNSNAVVFDSSDSFEALLTALDGINASVVLEVQPGYAELTDLADAMYAAYGTHKSVTGMSFDLQYYRAADSLSDTDAQSLVAFVSGKNANYSVEVRSSDTSNFPSSNLTGLTFVLDTAKRTSLASIGTAEASFAQTYGNSPIKFIVGATGQRDSVCSMTSPEVAMLTTALQAGKTVRGIYWSSSTVATLSPGKGFSCADTSETDGSSPAAGTTNTGSSPNTGTTGGASSGTTGNTGTTGGTSTGTVGSTPTTGGASGGTTGGTGMTGGTTGSTGTVGGSVGTGSTGGTTGSTGSTGTTGGSSTGTIGTTPTTGTGASTSGTSAGSTGGSTGSTGSTGTAGGSSTSSGGATGSAGGASTGSTGGTGTTGGSATGNSGSGSSAGVIISAGN